VSVTTFEYFMTRLEEVARDRFHGHFTVMRFSSNWRVGFGTPHKTYSNGSGGPEMYVGKTFEEAAEKALAKPLDVWCITLCEPIPF